jgi:hypothetical protein
MQNTRNGSAPRSAVTLTRRRLLEGVTAAALAPIVLTQSALRAQAPAGVSGIGPLSPSVLPPGIRSRFVDNVNGLRMHILEAGYETPGRPAVLLIHGFPELAYSWRKVMGPVAAAGFHVFAPDVRGHGRTSGAESVKYADDLRPFGTLSKMRDMLALVSALGYRTVNVVGHDAGAPLAAGVHWHGTICSGPW